MKCRRCRAALTAQQVYRRNRYCSVRCANARSKGGTPWHKPLRWQRVLAMLGDEWYVSLADIAILEYGKDDAASLHAARETIRAVRQAGIALEWRDFPWPNLERRSIRGYRLAQVPASKEAVA